MASPRSSCEVLDREFLPARAKILEIASSLDRIGRADDGTEDDPRWSQLHAALRLLLEDHEERAEQVQLLFSRPYDSDWRNALGVQQR
jgi:hypothetical protein